jgi:acyl-coenzyme A synthetase/AMP-(fatty) acid ligase/acyl carrier protein
LVGGEAFPQELFEQLKPTLAENRVTIYNLYGPTETTIWSGAQNLTHQAAITIGKPIANTVIYILDKYLNLVPPGIAGEICITGSGLARGYLNQPQLTAEKFDQDLWEKNNQKLLRGVQGGGFLEKSPPGRRRQKLYRTGDLACWLPDGNIEFLGRMDHQVKIRGFRVEPGEIEYYLLSHAGIKEAVVLEKEKKRENDENYLCAYIVPKDAHVDLTGLRNHLAKLLPHYMVPGHFVTMEHMPVTPGGKVDRQTLLNYKDTRAQPGNAYEAPATYMEKLIAAAWKEVLQLKEVSIHDHFFDLGGNSFDIIKINSQLAAELKRDFPVVKMFKYPTIGSLADYLQHGEPAEIPEEKKITMSKKIDKGKERLKQRARTRT